MRHKTTYKSLIAVSLAALALSGCQRESLEPTGSVIKYKVAVADVATKGTLVNNNETGDYSDRVLADALSPFHVAAYNGTSPVFTTSTLSPAGVETVTYADGSWTMPNTYYWPLQTELTFFAYANLSEEGSSVEITSAGQTLTHEMVSDVADQKDILLGYYHGRGVNGNTAEIRFAHPLTAVIFKKGDIGDQIITGITLSGLAASGTVTMDADGTIGNWQDVSDYTAESSQSNSEGLTVDGTTDVIGEPFIIIPQNLANNNVTVTVTLDDDTIIEAMLSTGEWRAGYTNTYTLGYGEPEIPALLPGLISVSPTKQVQFSRGNLYYNGSTFEFEANQYGHVENGAYNASHVAHFFWSKDESVARANSYSDPGFSTSDVFFTNATVDTPKSDFTVNGETGKYRILSAPEWQYALFTRIVNGGTGLGHTHSVGITYGGIDGMVIYPDNYTGTVLSGALSNLPEGVVFLPLAGERGTGQGVFNVNNGHGFYWSSSIDHSSFPYRAHLYDFDPNNSFADRASLILSGNSVRMVADYVKPLPAGALPGKFSVSATKQVHFSQGNLQATYNGTDYDWGFAANQYDCVGNAPGNTTIASQETNSVVDLFGWSTAATYYGINTSAVASTYSGSFKEWGENIGDGSTWYTLSYDEWNYLIYTRTVNGGTGYGHSYTHNITYGGIMGIVLYPDGFTGTPLTSGAIYTSLPDGIVFLPAAGARSDSTVSVVGIGAAYWSSFAKYVDAACGLYLDATTVSVPDTWNRSNAVSVRLVTNAN